MIPLLIVLIASCAQNPVAPVEQAKLLAAGEPVPGETAMNALDDIKLIGADGTFTLYENAEDGRIDRWFNMTNDGLTGISNVYDPERGSRVIQLATQPGVWYALGTGSRSFSDAYWNNTTQFTIEWSMIFNVYFEVRVWVVDTEGNWIAMMYSADDYMGPYPDTYPPYSVFIGLGANAADGTWKTYRRDLNADLQRFFPDAKIESVIMFKIWGRTPPEIPPQGEAYTPGFWKNNLRKMLQGKTNGTQIEPEKMKVLLDLVHEFYSLPFTNVSGTPEGAQAAYSILNAKGPDPITILKKHLLAAELNYFNGVTIAGGPLRMEQFLREGEDMILHPGSRSEILALKDRYDLFNNGGLTD